MKVSNKIILLDLNKLLRINFPDDLKDIVLFGSRTLDNVRADSDYDILIILKKKVGWEKERLISDLCYEIDLKYNIITDTHVISEDEFATLRGKQPIFIYAIEKGYRA